MLKQLPFAVYLAAIAVVPVQPIAFANTPKQSAPQAQLKQQQEPASGVVKLTQADLPTGFQELPPEFKSVLASQLAAFKPPQTRNPVPLDNIFAFVEPNNLQTVFGFSDKLESPVTAETFDAGLQQLQQPQLMAQAIDKLKQRLQKVPGVEIVDYKLLTPQQNLGNRSVGMTLAMKMRNLPTPLRMDITVFRRGKIIAATGVGYMDNTKPVVYVNDLAAKLDSRIVQSSGFDEAQVTSLIRELH